MTELLLCVFKFILKTFKLTENLRERCSERLCSSHLGPLTVDSLACLLCLSSFLRLLIHMHTRTHVHTRTHTLLPDHMEAGCRRGGTPQTPNYFSPSPLESVLLRSTVPREHRAGEITFEKVGTVRNSFIEKRTSELSQVHRQTPLSSIHA